MVYAQFQASIANFLGASDKVKPEDLKVINRRNIGQEC